MERCPQPACDFSGQMLQLVWGLGEGLGSGIFRRAIRGFQKAGVRMAGTVGVQGPPLGTSSITFVSLSVKCDPRSHQSLFKWSQRLS